MSLTAGTRLGSYEIVEPIGVGGMGEVYRAHDTKLKPCPLGVPILTTNDVKEAKRSADSKRLECAEGVAIVDRVASTVIILDRGFSAADRDRLSTDPLALVPRFFQLL